MNTSSMMPRLTALAGVCLLSAGALGLLGCESEKPAQPAASAPAAPAEVKPATVKAPEPVSLDSIPAEEDFEEEAMKEVTSANMEERLDSLEKEIGQ